MYYEGKYLRRVTWVSLTPNDGNMYGDFNGFAVPVPEMPDELDFMEADDAIWNDDTPETFWGWGIWRDVDGRFDDTDFDSDGRFIGDSDRLYIITYYHDDDTEFTNPLEMILWKESDIWYKQRRHFLSAV